MASMDQVLAIILGGGRGSRLFPLTRMRSKPAVPIAGKYRLIDIPISNCINSDIFRVAVLTQFNSVSLHRHIIQTYKFDVFHTGWVQIWAAEQTIQNADWYQGTADAVRKQIFQIQSTHAKHVLILAGDHLYRMNYRPMVDFHVQNGADITVAVQPVLAEEASRFGLLKRGPDYHITRFAEKPKDPDVLADLVSREDPIRPYLGSMGIYLFRTELLIDLLKNHHFDDFGGHVIPYAIDKHSVVGYDFEGYWEDIGTIRSFYETNLMLTRPDAKFDFYDPQNPIYSNPRFLPGSKVTHSVLENVLLAEGCCVEDSEIRHSVVGLRSQIRSGTQIFNSVLMGADFYEQFDNGPLTDEDSMPPIGIGRDCQIDGAIIDKNARVGRNVIIKPFPRGFDRVEENWAVQDGIVIITKNAIIAPGTVIAPD